MYLLILEREVSGTEREREINVREKHQLVASLWAATRDGTSSLLVYVRTLQPTQPHSQGKDK